MDKKKLLQIKNGLLKCWIPIVILVAIYMIMAVFIFDVELEDVGIMLMFISIFAVPYFLLCIVLSLIIKIKGMPKSIKADGYNRELPFDYSPAIVSVLCDNYLEGLVDIEAVKINLRIKERKIEDTGYMPVLSQHELYIVKHWNKYSVNEFKKILYNDMEKMGLIKTKKVNEIVRFIVSSFVVVAIFLGIGRLVSMFTYSLVIIGIAFILMLLTLLFILPMYLAFADNVKIKQTELGKKHKIEWLKFKNFLEDFTLLNKKEKKSVILYKEYIPYSMAVGVGEKIEKEIFGDYWEELNQ